MDIDENDPFLNFDEQKTLLVVARQSLESAFVQGRPYKPDRVKLTGKLLQPGASFVTLTKRGELRGCIGSVEAIHPLADDVAANSQNAAFRDPRFLPVSTAELSLIDIEVSVLTPLKRIDAKTREERLSSVIPHRDGVLLSMGFRRGLLLPQVWEKLPDKMEFMEHVCLKAMLPSTALDHKDLEMYIFQVQSFKEEGT